MHRTNGTCRNTTKVTEIHQNRNERISSMARQKQQQENPETTFRRACYLADIGMLAGKDTYVCGGEDGTKTQNPDRCFGQGLNNILGSMDLLQDCIDLVALVGYRFPLGCKPLLVPLRLAGVVGTGVRVTIAIIM